MTLHNMTGDRPDDSDADLTLTATDIAGDRLAAIAAAAPAVGAAAAVAPDRALIRSVMAGIMLAMFLSALEQTIVAPALPAIGKSLADIDNLSWVVTAYLLAATATTPLFGKLSDIHGRRAIMLVAIGIFIVASVVCAMAPTMWVLVLGRALQGIGGGGLLPIAQTIIADMLTPRQRPLAQSYTSVVFMSASILGPVLGGLLTDHLHWSLIFWINLPLGVAALVMTERALRRLPRHDRPHRLDVPGVVLMVAAAVALLLALDWGGTRYGWSSWPIVSLFAGSAALWVLFALRLLSAREPFIPLAILGGRITGTITGAAFFSIGTVIAITIYTPLYCQVVLGVSASVSGLPLIAFMGGTTVGAMATGRLFAQLTHYLRIPVVGLVLSVAILAYLAVDPAAHSLVGFTLWLGLLGVTTGPMYPTTTIVIQNAVKPHQMGVATGTLNFFRLLGGAIIVAGCGAIVIGSAGSAGGLASLESLAAGHGDFAPAFRLVFIAAALCLAVALACVLALEERPLHGPVRLADSAE